MRSRRYRALTLLGALALGCDPAAREAPNDPSARPRGDVAAPTPAAKSSRSGRAKPVPKGLASRPTRGHAD